MAFGLSRALLNSYTASYHPLWHETLASEKAPHHPKTRGLEIILAHLWPCHSWCPHSSEVEDLVWSLTLTSVSPTIYQEASVLWCTLVLSAPVSHLRHFHADNKGQGNVPAIILIIFLLFLSSWGAVSLSCQEATLLPSPGRPGPHYEKKGMVSPELLFTFLLSWASFLLSLLTSLPHPSLSTQG